MALQADLYQKKGHFNMPEKQKKPMSEAQKAHIEQLANARRGTKMKYTVTEKTLEARRKGGETRRGKEMPQYTVSEKKLVALKQLHESNRGKKQTEEQKRKSGDAVKRKYDTDSEFRERQRQAAIKTTTDPEVRKKNSEAQQQLWLDPDHVQKHKEAMARTEVREKLRQGQLGRVHTEEHNNKIAEGTRLKALERWKDVPFDVRQLHTVPALRASQEAHPSSLEVQIAGLLDALGIEYIPQYEVDMAHVDFYVPSRNLIIEVYGCYWHQCDNCGHPDLGKREQDRKRQYFLRSKGYNLYMLWEHDMKDINSPGMAGLMSRLTSHDPPEEGGDVWQP
jgi:G:T-mismatch repair DNA endonuclease (very short patch repair protein)